MASANYLAVFTSQPPRGDDRLDLGVGKEPPRIDRSPGDHRCLGARRRADGRAVDAHACGDRDPTRCGLSAGTRSLGLGGGGHADRSSRRSNRFGTQTALEYRPIVANRLIRASNGCTRAARGVGTRRVHGCSGSHVNSAGEQRHDGATSPLGEDMSILEAIRAALIDEMERDERVMLFGMDVGTLGGVFRVTQGLQTRFGAERVFDTPLAEGAIVGSSVGLAIGGMIPVPEIQFLGFTYQAFHQIGPQLARFRSRTRGRFHMPVTIRAPCGGGARTPEFHADAVEAQFSQAPGLKIVCPAFPDDARHLLSMAIRDPDPVLFVEPQRLYRTVRGPVSADAGSVLPFGHARMVREGTDVTLIAWGAAVHLCLEAAAELRNSAISAAVLDLRTLVPLDVEGLVEAVTSTGRAVVVHEAPLTGGFGAEISATLHEEAFRDLSAPVLRVCGRDVPYPPGPLEDHFLPTVRRVVNAVHRTVHQ
jgi:pyruvate dehydrogenase E1 component beta subunit